MNFRTKSLAWQWGLWSIAALVAVAAYVVLVRFVFGYAVGDFLGEGQQRVLLPILAVLGVFAYETRWNGVSRENQDVATCATEVHAEIAGESSVENHEPRRTSRTEPSRPLQSGAVAMPKAVTEVSPMPVVIKMDEPPSGTGEAEYALARRIPHQMIPDYSQNVDGRYLDLLGRSAVCGYPPALAKLGEYAIRRDAWVEAYYWTWRAHRAGMKELEPVLRSIRLSWATEGYPDEVENVHRLFSQGAGSIGRALLNIESGRELPLAKAYLQKHHPEFLG